MAWLDDSAVRNSTIEIIHPVGRRRITHVIHDVDGTHSLIRDWPPVMSLSMHWAMTCGLGEDFDSRENEARLIAEVGRRPLPEMDTICHDNAGFSAITQLEYGVRRAIELGNLPRDGLALTARDIEANSLILERIRRGEERFEDIEESDAVTAFLHTTTPRLFKLYERILNGACRDRNTADAWRNPEKWRVPGSMEFLRRLHDIGCVNYFVTGAVIYEEGGMFEEVRAVGFEVGPGKTVESLRGSSWDEKMPKDEVMEKLFREEDIDPRMALVVGDGRTEIKAGVDMGCVTMSCLPKDDKRLREIHVGLGANMIVQDYTDPAIKALIHG